MVRSPSLPQPSVVPKERGRCGRTKLTLWSIMGANRSQSRRRMTWIWRTDASSRGLRGSLRKPLKTRKTTLPSSTLTPRDIRQATNREPPPQKQIQGLQAHHLAQIFMILCGEVFQILHSNQK